MKYIPYLLAPLLLLAACSQGINTVSLPDLKQARMECGQLYQQEHAAHNPHTLTDYVQCLRTKVLPSLLLVYPDKKNDINDLYNTMDSIAAKDDAEGADITALRQYYHIRAKEIGLDTVIYCPKSKDSDAQCVVGQPPPPPEKIPKVKAW